MAAAAVIAMPDPEVARSLRPIFAGRTGLGDLMATCMSPPSRNRQVGEQRAGQRGLEMPTAAEVDAVIRGERTAERAFRGLRRVAPGSESDAVA